MKKIFLFLIVVFAFTQTHAQYVHKIKADSVLITNDSCTAELNLENSTKHINGFLYNKGNGRTEFRKVIKLNDSTVIFGGDTLVIGGSLGNLIASNGITKSGNEILLGQTIGAPGNAADFTSDREIPLATKRLHLKDGRITMKLSTLYQPAIHITDSADNSLLMIKAVSQPIDATLRRATSIFIGDSAGLQAISYASPTTTGAMRVALGHKAMFADGQSNFSTAIGAQAMQAAGYKPWSTALGYSALGSATTGSADNTALGYVTMYYFETGRDNVGIGSHAMRKGTHIDSSVAVGTWSLSNSDNVSTGNYRREVAIGMSAGRQIGGFTGSGNVRIGFRAGQDIGTTATGNVLIGHDVARGINVGDNKLYIANTNTSNPLLYGEFDNALLRVGGRLKINNVPDGSSTDSLLVWNNTDSLVKKIAFGGAGWLLSGNAGTNPANNFIGTTDSQALVLRTNNIERMRVTPNGNVGIGTAIPNYKLTIEVPDTSSTLSPWSYTHVPSTQALRLGTNDASIPSINSNALISLGRHYGAGIMLYDNLNTSTNCNGIGISPSAMQFYTSTPWADAYFTWNVNGYQPVTGTNEIMRLKNNGNLMIGTTVDEGYKLNVNGTVKISTLPFLNDRDTVLTYDPSTKQLMATSKKPASFAQTATGTVTGDVETTLITSGTGNLTIPSSAWVVGKSYKVTVYGVYSTSSSNPANINLRLKLGSVTIATSGTIFLGSGKANVPFTLQATIVCRTTGSSGTVFTFGDVFRDNSVDHVNNGTNAATINMTTNQTFDVTVQQSDSSTGNAVSAYIVTLEAIN